MVIWSWKLASQVDWPLWNICFNDHGDTTISSFSPIVTYQIRLITRVLCIWATQRMEQDLLTFWISWDHPLFIGGVPLVQSLDLCVVCFVYCCLFFLVFLLFCLGIAIFFATPDFKYSFGILCLFFALAHVWIKLHNCRQLLD